MRCPLPISSSRATRPDATAQFARLFDCVSQLAFVHSPHFGPTNIVPAFLSPLSCHNAQLDATFANSPPPGSITVPACPAPCSEPLEDRQVIDCVVGGLGGRHHEVGLSAVDE